MNRLISGCVMALCGTLALGCGSPSPKAHVGQTPMAGDGDAPDPSASDTMTPMRPASAMGERDAVPSSAIPRPDEAPTPEPAPAPTPDPSVTAMVSFRAAGTFKPKKPKAAKKEASADAEDASSDTPGMELADDELGHLEIVEQDGKVTMSGVFHNLPAGDHGIVILATSDCRAKKSEHFNPTKTRHGPPASAERHAGDYGNLSVAKDGTASFEMMTDSVTVTGEDSIVGKAFVVTSKKDNGKTQPDGKAGTPIACGVIELENAMPQPLASGAAPTK